MQNINEKCIHVESRQDRESDPQDIVLGTRKFTLTGRNQNLYHK